MAFVDVAIAVGAAVGLEGGAAILGGGAIIGAGTGAAYSAITGDGNVLNSALTGGLIGGAGAYGLSAMGAGSAATQAAFAGPFWGGAATTAAGATPAMTAAQLDKLAAANGVFAEGSAALPGAGLSVAPDVVTPSMIEAGKAAGSTGLTGSQLLGYGLAGSAALSLLGNMNTPKLSSQAPGQNQAYIRPYTYAANPTNNYPTSYNGLGSSAERTYFNPTMTAQPIYKAAAGGLTPSADKVDFMGAGAYPMSQQATPHYSVPSQMPMSAQQVRASYEPDTNPLTGEPIAMAEGGAVDINNINPDIWNKIDSLVTKVSTAQPAPAPAMTMANNPAVQAYNDAIMAKAAQTYATPQGGLAQIPQAQNPLGQAQLMAPQGYQAPQAPANFDSGLLSQWQAANPQSRAFNALTQTYGAGIPSQAEYDAFKTQKDKEAEEARNPFGFGGFRPAIFDAGGGGAAGGLPRDFAYAGGGHLGSYSDGGRMLKGPGDGMSDNIPASIGGKQPARLADGEFVVPADVVSHLGNGSTDAGAKRLYAMMDNVRKARTGSKKQGKQIKAEKYLPT